MSKYCAGAPAAAEGVSSPTRRERRRFANVELPPNFLINHYDIPSIAHTSKAHRLPGILARGRIQK